MPKFVEGLQDLEKALFELKTTTAKSQVRRNLKVAAQPVADAMNRAAPVDPEGDGDPLSESYEVSTRLNRTQRRERGRPDPAEVTMYVGSTTPQKAIQQEFGNAQHGAQPHARPAWARGGPAVLERFTESATASVDKAVARARRKQARAGK